MVIFMKYIITIGREYGSGGRFIGKLVAEKLKVPFYDSELLEKAASESGLNEAIFKNYDEKKDGLFGTGYGGIHAFDMSLSQKVFLAEFDAIRKIADEGSCVIVGRCADYALKDRNDVINVFICAPIEQKVERAIKYYGLEEAKAENHIYKINKKRKNYYNFYTDRDWGKASNYDLCLNSKIGIDACVDLVIDYVNEFKKINCK
jgi:cytidylate kinase